MDKEAIVGKTKDSPSETRCSEEKINSTREGLIGDLENKLPHVEIKEKVNVMGYEGEIYIINLPKVGNFNGFKCDFFISYDDVKKGDFERNPELEKKLKSVKSVGSLLMAINEYMEASGLETDGIINYEEDLKYVIGSSYNHKKKTECIAGDYFKHITGLNNKILWVKDNCEYLGFKFRYFWSTFNDFCFFNYSDNDYDSAKLFIDLSDHM